MKGLFFCFTLITISLHAQQGLIDSLQKASQAPTPTTHDRIMTMARLADAYTHGNPALAKQTALMALTMAKKSGDPDAISFIYSNEVLGYVQSDSMELAQDALDSASHYAKRARPLYKGLAWLRKGYLQNIQNEPDSAVVSWQKALDYLDVPGGALYKAGIFYLCYGIYAERNDTVKSSLYARAWRRPWRPINDTLIFTKRSLIPSNLRPFSN